MGKKRLPGKKNIQKKIFSSEGKKKSYILKKSKKSCKKYILKKKKIWKNSLEKTVFLGKKTNNFFTDKKILIRNFRKIILS